MSRFHPTEESGRQQAVAAVSSRSVATDQRTIEETIRKLPPSSDKATRITQAIAAFIAKDLHPYSIVENQGFRALLHTLEPRYTIPSRRYFTDTAIPKLYSETKAEVYLRQVGSQSHVMRGRLSPPNHLLL